MSKLSNKIKIILFVDLILFVACIVGIYQTYEKAGLEPIAHVSFDLSQKKVIVNKVTDTKLKAVFSPGDQLISIESHPISTKDDIEFVFDAFQVGQIVSVLIERNGTELHQTITLPRYYTWLYLIVQIIVGCVFFINGIFVIYKITSLIGVSVEIKRLKSCRVNIALKSVSYFEKPIVFFMRFSEAVKMIYCSVVNFFFIYLKIEAIRLWIGE